MNALVETAAGLFAVDLETDEVEPSDEGLEPRDELALNLPRVVVGGSAVTVARGEFSL